MWSQASAVAIELSYIPSATKINNFCTKLPPFWRFKCFFPGCKARKTNPLVESSSLKRLTGEEKKV